MQPLRWKGRYRSGDAETDRLNKAVVQCLNTLIEASRKREHCREMEDLLSTLVEQAETLLRQSGQAKNIRDTLRDQLMAQLPLPNYATQSCHSCGLCDLAEMQVAEHLEPPAQCLAIQLRRDGAAAA